MTQDPYRARLASRLTRAAADAALQAVSDNRQDLPGLIERYIDNGIALSAGRENVVNIGAAFLSVLAMISSLDENVSEADLEALSSLVAAVGTRVLSLLTETNGFNPEEITAAADEAFIKLTDTLRASGSVKH